MAKTADDLREEVLALPAQERARIASDLLASLDSEAVDEVELDELWSAETQRRAAMLESGDVGTLTWHGRTAGHDRTAPEPPPNLGADRQP